MRGPESGNRRGSSRNATEQEAESNPHRMNIKSIGAQREPTRAPGDPGGNGNAHTWNPRRTQRDSGETQRRFQQSMWPRAASLVAQTEVSRFAGGAVG